MSGETLLDTDNGRDVKQLSGKLKELRKKMGWVQEDLAQQIGVSLSTVQRWESKEVNPTRLARRALARLLKKAGINNE